MTSPVNVVGAGLAAVGAGLAFACLIVDVRRWQNEGSPRESVFDMMQRRTPRQRRLRLWARIAFGVGLILMVLP